MKTTKLLAVLIFLLPGLYTSLQGQVGRENQDMGGPDTGIHKAICVLYPTEGNSAVGVVKFEQVKGGVKVTVDMHGLTPGKHGFHIHEYGDCSAPDGTSAGGHFNPMMEQHGGPMDKIRHEGDMGNVFADESGNAHLEYVDSMLSFTGKESIIGRGIIVHQNEDDFKTQPTGNAGPRVACGTIGVAKD